MLAVFRGDPVETELAGVLEDGRSVAEMCSLNWTPTPLHLPQQRLQAAPALLQRIWSKVDAAQLQQAERVQERPAVVSLTVEHFEVRHAPRSRPRTARIADENHARRNRADCDLKSRHLQQRIGPAPSKQKDCT